ncbi:uncharacterized protein LOC127241353 [Andrographis paniculata]|uniref:uncharacterized protein LOC127241353 n=1 Tax=Andrographis paniculata TaxID=175694 RepID=UPI0021E74A75|nr:uncharacterized protein LOC127241353 [Andrographis paniculata]
MGKQAKWLDFLAQLKFKIEYRPGKTNVVADVLSWKVAAIHSVERDIVNRIRQGLVHNKFTHAVLELVEEGKMKKYSLEDGLVVTKGYRMYVADTESIRRDILRELVDRFSKYAEFIPEPKKRMEEVMEKLFMEHVIKYWRLPTSIVSDRDSRFTGRFWTELFRLLGLELKVSTTMHPQTDGQTE